MGKGLAEGKRYEIVGMFKAGKTVLEINKATGVSRGSIYAILRKYDERGGDLKRAKGQGRKFTKNTKVNLDIIRKRVTRCAKQSISSLARDMKMARGTMRKLVKKLGMFSAKGLLQHDIMPGQKARRPGGWRGPGSC